MRYRTAAGPALGFGLALTFATAADPAPKPDRAHALAFVAQHCAGCHSGATAKGQLVLTKLTGNPAADAGEALLWARVVERVSAGEMPPKEKPQPTAAERAALAEWTKGELKRAAEVRPVLAAVGPSAGNRVPHELLFGAPANGPGASEPRAWRNRLPIYEDYYIRALNAPGFKRPLPHYEYRFELEIPLHEYSPPWGGGSGHGFKDHAPLARVGEAELEILMANAGVAVERLIERKPRGKPSAVAVLRDAASPTAEQVRAALGEAFQLVVLREPTGAEHTRYAALFEKNKPLGHAKAVHTTLTAVFLHPESVYRIETARGTPDAHGRAPLAPRELARAVAFALTDRAPDAELLRAADAGELKTKADVEKQLKRLFADDTVVKTRVVDFFREFFGYRHAEEVFKDEKTLKAAGIAGYWPASLEVDTDQLVLLVLREDKDVLKELLTTRRGYVDYARKPAPKKGKPDAPLAPAARYSPHYNYESDSWSPVVPVTFPAGQRAGVLTQPSWLVAHSTNFENHAIERGKWVREKLLGGALPDVPLTVEAKLPDDAHRTLRQRMDVTRQTFCWQCHKQMDPLGLVFEQYDHFGRHRERELGKPVDASGELTGTGDPKLDGPVTGPADLMDRLARSERVRQVFVRHAFRFWMGRNESPADAAALQAADRAYVASGGSMKALVTALLTSDAFLFRWAK
jgi:mono/diheme cytochrome c family protein